MPRGIMDCLRPVCCKPVVALICILPVMVHADGIVVDKIYHPYVEALEKEIGYRAVIQDSQPGLVTQAQLHKFSLGSSIGDRLFAEIYAVESKTRTGLYKLEAWEGELKWQLTEQGQYSADWGLLFEYEKEEDVDVQEASFGILAEKEFGRWSGTANLKFINEWGQDIQNEFETVLALQARYRASRAFEPGVEVYAGQFTKAIGPVVQGTFNMGVRHKLHWEGGVLAGVDGKSPDASFRFLFEFSF